MTGEAPDLLREIVREEALGAVSQWVPGYTEPADGSPQQYYITYEGCDDASHTIDLAIGEQRYDTTRRFRVSVLVEEIEKR